MDCFSTCLCLLISDVSLLVCGCLTIAAHLFCLLSLAQMEFELLIETTAMNVPGMPQFLREIWSHLYPTSPLPKYSVSSTHLGRTRSEFTATVCLHTEPVSQGHKYTFSSDSSHQVTGAIQEAAHNAIVLLRTHNPIMENCTRYSHFPRLDLSSGDTLLPVPEDSTAELACLLRHTYYLHEYQDDTLSQLDTLHAKLVTAEAAIAAGPGSSHQNPPFPSQPTRSTLGQLKKRPASAPARFSPFFSASPMFPPSTPESRFQGCHIPTSLPSYTLGSSMSSIDTDEGSIDTIPPATPIEMEFKALQ